MCVLFMRTASVGGAVGVVNGAVSASGEVAAPGEALANPGEGF